MHQLTSFTILVHVMALCEEAERSIATLDRSLTVKAAYTHRW